MKKIQTLCIIQKGEKILLGMKKRGFGVGRWNGFGGKIEAEEKIIDAVKREIKEEAGIDVREIEPMGIINFEFQGDPVILEVHIFKTANFTGDPVETEEMKPQWFDIGNIPYNSMWPDDKFWLPLLLENKKFRGKFLFQGDDTICNTHILEHKVEIKENL